MNFRHFVGIDISKNKLDVVFQEGNTYLFHKVIDNSKEAIKAFLSELESIKGFQRSYTVFCMEHTGIYNTPVLEVLYEQSMNICLETATHIKSSLGNIRGKNDKVDAKRIASYAYKNKEELRLWIPKREVIQRLKHLTVLRDRLINTRKALQVPLKEQKVFLAKIYKEHRKLSKRTLNAIEADLEKVEKAIMKIIKEDSELTRLFGIITSVQGVGKQTAVQVIVTTNEFKDITTSKKFACYSGIAPFTKESGMFKGRARVSHMANKKVKKTLHMAAMSAINHNHDMKRYYERKVEEGKNKMLVINAVRNKLVTRIFTCVNENRKYHKTNINLVV